jgi:pimeloyl-ACP methyl ester carboxylesterase
MIELLQRPLVVAVGLLAVASPPAQSTDAMFDSNGVQICYVTEGVGEAIVAIYGWMGDSSTWGRDLRGETRLKGMPGFRAIGLDCRGQGQSDKPRDVGRYGAEMAVDVLRLLDHLQIEKAHLIGYSSGAFVVGKVAAMRPDRVLSIIHAGQAPLLLAPEPAADTKPAPDKAAPSEVEVFARIVEEGRDLGEYPLAIIPPDGRKLTPAQAKALAKLMYGGKDLKAFVAAGRSFGRSPSRSTT